jgi:hypothetical protein
MTVDRRTPTTANFGPTIAGSSYADAVNEEVGALWDRTTCWLDSVAGTNTITANADPALIAYNRGNQYNFIPAVTNTGPATLAINGLAARSIRTVDGVALVGGELVAGRLIRLQDDGTNLRTISIPPVGAQTAFAAIATQVFTATGTYTPNALMRYVRVRMVGPGGGGGGADGVNSGGVVSGAGGGAGEYAEGYFDAATIGASQSITIGAQGAAGSTTGAGGAGGTTSLGSLMSVNGGGGGGGTGNGAIASQQDYLAGSGGTGGTGGFLRIQGGAGSGGVIDTYNDGSSFTSYTSGRGGPSMLGMPPKGQNVGSSGAGSDVTGSTGNNYGAGGNPGVDDDASGSAGGAGGPSVVIIEEYLRAA